MRQLLKSFVDETLSRLPTRHYRNRDVVLAYHNVLPDSYPEIGDVSLHARLSVFERQLDILAEQTTVVPLMEILSTRSSVSRRSAVTFDDAYAGALHYGAQACEDRGIPYTIFVAPRLLGRVPIWDIESHTRTWSPGRREQFLTTEFGDASRYSTLAQDVHASANEQLEYCRVATAELLEACRSYPGISFGSHTNSHLNCRVAPPSLLKADVDEAESILKALFGKKLLPVLAYPYGMDPLDAERRSIISSHSQFAMRVDGGYLRNDSDLFSLPRWNIPRGLSASAFQATLRGWKRLPTT